MKRNNFVLWSVFAAAYAKRMLPVVMTLLAIVSFAAPVSDVRGDLAVPMQGAPGVSRGIQPRSYTSPRSGADFRVLPVYGNDAFRNGTVSYGTVSGVVGVNFNGGARSSKSVTFRPASMSVPSASSFTKAGGTPTFATTPAQLYEPISPMMRAWDDDDPFDPGDNNGGFDTPGEIGRYPLTGEWLLLLFLAIMMITKRLLPLRGEVARSARGGEKSLMPKGQRG